MNLAFPACRPRGRKVLRPFPRKRERRSIFIRCQWSSRPTIMAGAVLPGAADWSGSAFASSWRRLSTGSGPVNLQWDAHKETSRMKPVNAMAARTDLPDWRRWFIRNPGSGAACLDETLVLLGRPSFVPVSDPEAQDGKGGRPYHTIRFSMWLWPAGRASRGRPVGRATDAIGLPGKPSRTAVTFRDIHTTHPLPQLDSEQEEADLSCTLAKGRPERWCNGKLIKQIALGGLFISGPRPHPQFGPESSSHWISTAATYSVKQLGSGAGQVMRVKHLRPRLLGLRRPPCFSEGHTEFEKAIRNQSLPDDFPTVTVFVITVQCRVEVRHHLRFWAVVPRKKVCWHWKKGGDRVQSSRPRSESAAHFG